MGIHVEWMSAAHTGVEAYAPGDPEHPDYTLEGGEAEAESYALVLGVDDAVVIEGDLDRLRFVLRRALVTLDGAANGTRCVCAIHDDGSVTRYTCPTHADSDPCQTMAGVTGKRRKGTIRRGRCTNCGWHGEYQP